MVFLALEGQKNSRKLESIGTTLLLKNGISEVCRQVKPLTKDTFTYECIAIFNILLNKMQYLSSLKGIMHESHQKQVSKRH